MTDKDAINSLFKHHLELQNQVLQLSGQLMQAFALMKIQNTKIQLLQEANEKFSTNVSQISKN